jgi:hypothetical protein
MWKEMKRWKDGWKKARKEGGAEGRMKEGRRERSKVSSDEK